HGSLLWRLRSAGDQARAALKSEELKRPADQHNEPVLKLNQVHEMYEQPDQPGGPSPHFEAADVGHRVIASDYSHVAAVELLERSRRRIARQAALDQLAGIAAL